MTRGGLFRNEWPLVVFTSVALALLSIYRYLASPGYIFLAEQFEVLTAQQFLRVAADIFPLGVFSEADWSKLYLYLFLYAVSLGNYKALQAIALALPTGAAFATSYLFFRQFFGRYTALCLATAYVLNPLFLNQPRDIQLRFFYGFMPLLLYAATSRGRKANLIFTTVFGLTFHYRGAALLLLILIAMALFRLTTARRALFLYLLGLTFSAPLWLPAVIHASQGFSIALHTITIADIRRVNMLNALSIYYYYPGDHFEKIVTGLWGYSFLPVVIIAALGLLSRRMTAMFGAALLLVGILLTASEVNVDKILALNEALMRLFRQPYVNGIITLWGILFMLGNAPRRLQAAAAALLAALYLPLLLTGDMGGYWAPAQPPAPYYEIQSLNEGAVLWYPGMGDFRALWSNQRGPYDVSAPTGILELRVTPTIAYGAVESVRGAMAYTQYFAYFNLLNSSCFTTALPRLGLAPYRAVGIKYIGVVYDRAITEPYVKCGLYSGLLQLQRSIPTYGRLVINTTQIQAVDIGQAPLCRAGRPVQIYGGYPALAVLFHIYGDAAPPAVFASDGLIDGVRIKQGHDLIHGGGLHVGADKFRGNFTYGNDVLGSAFFTTLRQKGGLWPFDLPHSFMWGDNWCAEASIDLPDGVYKVYALAYLSNISGTLQIHAGGKTLTADLNRDEIRFRYVYLGEVKAGGPVKICAHGFAAVGGLLFAKKEEPADGVIYTPYDLSNEIYNNPKSPLGVAAYVKNKTIVIESDKPLELRMGVLNGTAEVLGATPGKLEIRLVNATVAYIAALPPDMPTGRPTSCTNPDLRPGELLQINTPYDPTWRLTCADTRPVRVYGLVNGFTEAAGHCTPIYTPYQWRLLATPLAAAALAIATFKKEK